MIEIWKDIEGFEGQYQVSNLGRVKSLDHYVKWKNTKHFVKGRILTQAKSDKGYLTVGLPQKRKKVHRLVADAFIENPNNLPTVDHINRDKTDNRVENLRWADMKSQCENRDSEPQIQAVKETLSKAVLQCDLDGNVIKVWVSMSEAERNGFNSSHISLCCQGKRKTHKNSTWMYA